MSFVIGVFQCCGLNLLVALKGHEVSFFSFKQNVHPLAMYLSKQGNVTQDHSLAGELQDSFLCVLVAKRIWVL